MLPGNDQYRQFDELKLENDKIVAKVVDCPYLDDGSCEKTYNVYFVYKNKELSIVKAS